MGGLVDVGRSENTQHQGGGYVFTKPPPPRPLFTHQWTLLSFIAISSFAHKTETVNACVCSYKNAVQLYIFHNNAGLFLYVLKYLVVGFLIYVFKLSGRGGKASQFFFMHRLAIRIIFIHLFIYYRLSGSRACVVPR